MIGFLFFLAIIAGVFFFLWHKSDKFKALAIAAGGSIVMLWEKLVGFFTSLANYIG